ncbi:MAG: diiron oxygenase, partial [Blastocatellia bacterium]
MDKETDFSAESQYLSKFQDWDDRARVRVSPRRLLSEEELNGKLYFSPGLVPIVGHPRIREMGQAAIRAILAQHLYGYLDFTTRFEVEVVNAATQEIAKGNAGLSLPEEMKFDAYKIYCDEAYHS